MVRKAVIPAAGLGTRLLSATKELPKEMLPIFFRDSNGEIYLKPMLQVLFEQLYKFGFREFCFIVGRGKRAVEDHFTPDYSFLDLLEKKGKEKFVRSLKEFYLMIERSTIIWINQPEPLGFGHAVYLSKSFVRDEPFLVAAGDTCIVSNNLHHIKELIDKHSEGTVVTLLIQEVEDPREYGVIITNEKNDIIKVVEKPKEIISNLAILPMYVFEPVIFNAIEATKKGYGNEIQLTDAIQKIIDWGLKVNYVTLPKDAIRLDIGTASYYYDALIKSYNNKIF
jgi:UDP-glucose pyrophosphorylase